MLTLRRVVITALLLFAVGVLWFATTKDASNEDATDARLLNSAVERVVPGDGDAALRQGEIGVDLAPSWTAVLSIDGTAIPEDQLRRNEPLNQVFFTPGEGKEIEELAPGPHLAQARIWRPGSQTAEEGSDVTWRFRVS